jgi:hypothetical protein
MAGMPLAGTAITEEPTSPRERDQQARAGEEEAEEATSPRERGQQARPDEEKDEGGRPSASARGATIPVPVVTPHLNVFKLHVSGPGVPDVGGAGRAVASHLPSAERMAFYGGLGAAAVFGVLEWPVAAAIALGTAIARRGHGSAQPESGRPESARQEAA